MTTRYQVYWNLHRQCWSIRNAKTRKVEKHATALTLTYCKFTVQEGGRQRVIREKRKNVHAFVEGDLTDLMPPTMVTGYSRVRYNPYENAAFQCADQAIQSAAVVYLYSDGQVWVRP